MAWWSSALGLEGTLELQGKCPGWPEEARRGRWTVGGSSRPCIAVLAPETTHLPVDLAREQAVEALQLEDPGVFPLLGVTAHAGYVAWVYGDSSALSLAHTLDTDDEHDLLPTRAGAEVVARVAEILVGLQAAGQAHGGPAPADVFLTESGAIRLAGFAGPPHGIPAPGSTLASESALVYRLGVLLAHLVGGARPAAASEEGAHAALVRRALIRAMARPGPVLTERYGDWLRGMLAWDPAERPPLTAVPTGLRKVAEATGGASLEEWAETNVKRILERRAQRVAEEERRPVATDEVDWRSRVQTGAPPARLKTEGTTQRRLRVVATGEEMEDDPTIEDTYDSSVGLLGARPPTDAMPVEVGPPAEVAARRYSLPEGFLEAAAESWETLDEEGPRPGSWGALAGLGWAVTGGSLFAAGVGLVLAVALLGYVLFPGSAESEGPGDAGVSLADALGRDAGRAVEGVVEVPQIEPSVEEPAPVDDVTVQRPVPPPGMGSDAVLFRAPGIPMVVVCAGQEERGTGEVWFPGLTGESCAVSGELPSGVVRVEEVVSEGPSTVQCFEGGRARCRVVR